jgi:hypothetical protein
MGTGCLGLAGWVVKLKPLHSEEANRDLFITFEVWCIHGMQLTSAWGAGQVRCLQGLLGCPSLLPSKETNRSLFTVFAAVPFKPTPFLLAYASHTAACLFFLPPAFLPRTCPAGATTSTL